MTRTSPVYYINPSAISIIPNANNRPDDIAVTIKEGTKIKVFSEKAGIGTVNGAFREWILDGKNRKLKESQSRYTVYARLRRGNQSEGYLTFAPMRLVDGVWIDRHPYVTEDGFFRPDGNPESETYYYIRLGEVSQAVNGHRTLTLDTGILGTDEFNTKWALNPDALPLHINLACTIDGKEAGPTPYVLWGGSVVLAATLTEGWTGTDKSRFEKFVITRNTNNQNADNSWNHPDGAGSSREMVNSTITLSHARGTGDDFNGAVSAVFVITALGRGTDSSSSDDELVPLVSVSINIQAETAEKYELQLSSSIVGYDPQSVTYNPANVSVRIRATDQRGETFDITKGQLDSAGLYASYLPVNAAEGATPVPVQFSGASGAVAVGSISTSEAFAAQQNINVRLYNALNKELALATIAFVRDGEDSKDREWIFVRKATAVTFGQTGDNIKPSLITQGEVNPTGAANGNDENKNQEGWVPNGWYDEEQGVTDALPYEYGSFRDHGDNGWGDFSMPLVKNHFGVDAYSVEVRPTLVSFPCNANGRSTSPAVKTVTLAMKRGGETIASTAVIVSSTNCTAWVNNGAVLITTGAAWEQLMGSSVYYTDKPKPYLAVGDNVYNASGTMVGTVTDVDTLPFAIKISLDGETEIALTQVMGGSYKDLGNGGSVVVDVTGSGKTIRVEIPVIGNKQGERGNDGDDGEDAYVAMATPPIVMFNCDANGQCKDTSVKEVTLGMTKGSSALAFVARVTNATRCSAWISSSKLHIGMGQAWKNGSNIIYTDKPIGYVASGDAVYGLDREATVTYVGTNYIQINDVAINYVAVANMPYHSSLSEDGQVNIEISGGGVTRSLVVTVAGRLRGDDGADGEDGENGKVGPFYYYGGVFDETDEVTTFAVNDIQIPFFQTGESSGVKNYHLFHPEIPARPDYTMKQMWDESEMSIDEQGQPIQGTQFDNAPWAAMTSKFRYLITEAIFGSYAHFGASIINGDWMLSQFGVIYDRTGEAHVIDETQTYSTGTKTYTYENAYTLFKTAHPNDNWQGVINFVPNYAVDMKKGKVYANECEIRGKVHATSGEFTGTVRAETFYTSMERVRIFPNGQNSTRYNDDIAAVPLSDFITTLPNILALWTNSTYDQFDENDNRQFFTLGVLLPAASDYQGRMIEIIFPCYTITGDYAANSPINDRYMQIYHNILLQSVDKENDHTNPVTDNEELGSNSFLCPHNASYGYKYITANLDPNDIWRDGRLVLGNGSKYTIIHQASVRLLSAYVTDSESAAFGTWRWFLVDMKNAQVR